METHNETKEQGKHNMVVKVEYVEDMLTHHCILNSLYIALEEHLMQRHVHLCVKAVKKTGNT